MNYWILPSNLNQFDVESCISEHNIIYWRQKNNYEVGDIVFIYCSGKIGKVRYAMIVDEIDILYDDAIMGYEAKYWLTENEHAKKEMKLRLLQDVNSDELTFQKLRQHGLRGNIQGPQTLNGELLEYILAHFSIKNSKKTDMESNNLLFSHRIDKSFLKYGFVISKSDELRNRPLIEKAIAEKLSIKVIFEGKEFEAFFDSPSSMQAKRFMFKTGLKDAIQAKFKECYIIDNNDITAKPEVVINVGFFSTDEECTFEARQIGETIIIDSAEMKKRYEDYLDKLDGAFTDYSTYIDRQFVKDKAKELFGVPSAYFMTSSEDVLTLVDEIRNDPVTNVMDKSASSRRPSCSLKKYAEFLKTIENKTTNMPFDTNVVIDAIAASGLIFDPKFVQRYLCSLLTKPFVILSGLTGSGKTQLAMAFPKLICKDKSQYKLIPVGADWTNREQLLGYPHAIRKGEYVMPDNGVLQLILEAAKPENQNKPYFLILDEMNMSYVERYFADFLSAMESGEEIPLWEGNDVVPASIKLPNNLFIIGTINVDETTYMFSPKVLDRASVIEFRISRPQMSEYLDSTAPISQLPDCSERAADFVAIACKQYSGSLNNEMKITLLDMFDKLAKIQKEFGYRTAHEMSRYITICKCYTNMTEEESIDSAVAQKLLPKVHGSRKKVSPVLKSLWLLCYKDEGAEIDTLEEMPPLDKFKYPLTAEKIWRMFLIAQDNGFTSFAEA